jgi:hypothetical protein
MTGDSSKLPEPVLKVPVETQAAAFDLTAVAIIYRDLESAVAHLVFQ